MSKPQRLIVRATVDKCERDGYSLTLDNGHRMRGYASGRLRLNHIQILPGDSIDCELSPYSTDLCRIIYRRRDEQTRASQSA